MIIIWGKAFSSSSFPAYPTSCAVFWQESRDAYSGLSLVSTHCHCCSFSPHVIVLGSSWVAPPRALPFSSPYLSSSSTLPPEWPSGKHSTAHGVCRSHHVTRGAPTANSVTALFTFPSFASQLYGCLLCFCVIFTRLSLKFSLNSLTPFFRLPLVLSSNLH